MTATATANRWLREEEEVMHAVVNNTSDSSNHSSNNSYTSRDKYTTTLTLIQFFISLQLQLQLLPNFNYDPT